MHAPPTNVVHRSRSARKTATSSVVKNGSVVAMMLVRVEPSVRSPASSARKAITVDTTASSSTYTHAMVVGGSASAESGGASALHGGDCRTPITKNVTVA